MIKRLKIFYFFLVILMSFSGCVKKQMVKPKEPTLPTAYIEYSIRSSGLKGVGGFKDSSIVAIRGEKKKVVKETKLSGLAERFIKSTPTIEIIRLDKEVIWKIDKKRNTYVKKSLRYMGEEALAKVTLIKKEIEKEEESPVVLSEITLSKGKEKRKIIGYNCTPYIIR